MLEMWNESALRSLALQGSTETSLGGHSPASKHGEEFADDFRVPESGAGFFLHRPLGVFMRQRRLVWTRGSERVIDIDDLENAGEQWDLRTLQSVWISRAVPMLMMAADYGKHIPQ